MRIDIFRRVALPVFILVFTVIMASAPSAAEDRRSPQQQCISALNLIIDKEKREMPPFNPGETITSRVLRASAHLELPLTNTLTLFYHMQRFTKDRPEELDYRKNWAVFGIDIFF